AADLLKLFDAHHYTDGLSFLLQGTPTNNTTEVRSGFNVSDPAHEASYVSERASGAFTAGDGSDADVITAAFGLQKGGAATFSSIENASVKQQLDTRHMNRALWPATWGYFLTQMVGVNASQERSLTPDDFVWARQHFIDYVRATGPLPALRIGNQPYGVLPITALPAWSPSAAD